MQLHPKTSTNFNESRIEHKDYKRAGIAQCLLRRNPHSVILSRSD